MDYAKVGELMQPLVRSEGRLICRVCLCTRRRGSGTSDR